MDDWPRVLRTRVATLWTHDETCDGRDLVVPSGRAQLVIDLWGRGHRWSIDGQGQTSGPAVLGGPSSTPVVIERRPGPLLGIVFHPTGLRPFLDRPVGEVADQHLDLGEVVPWAEQLVDAACAAHPTQRFKAVLDVLAPRATPADSGLVELVAHATTARVRDVADEAGLSTRQLRDLFAEHVGLSPKRWSRVRRIARSLVGLRQSDDFGALAHQLGFYDHAHFTRDFSAVVGRTPSEWRATMGPWDTHLPL
ncbi:MAG: helix-turn-helix transcriptional regulator [Myxococcota bacterium]